MAMRRRIKAGVNLTAAKRKPKSDPCENAQDVEDKTTPNTVKAEAPQTESQQSLKSQDVLHHPKDEAKADRPTDIHSDGAAFKCPPKVEFNRSNSYTSPHVFDDLNQSDIDDGAQVMQMDLQRSTNGFPMSPSKTQQRQRIKPTPIFGQRRNSLVGPPPSPSSLHHEDPIEQAASPQKRERHYSGSQSHTSTNNHIGTKPANTTGRIRTESTCSAFSDSHMSITSKIRKADDHSTHRSQARRDFEARFSNGVPEKSSLKMFDLIYYNPATNPMEQKPKVEQIKTETKEEEPSTESDTKNNDMSAVPVPQLKLNAKGELILDDKSLEIETTAEQEARKVLAKSSLIYLDENTGMNGFYKRQKRTREWPPDETIRFYRCLKTIGTDFSMMCQLFPKRTRRDLKLKFKKEERCNGALINKALLHPNSFNIQELKDQFETEDRQREEEERIKSKQRTIPYKKIHIKTSRSARALKNADDIYNHELRDVEAKKSKKQRKEKISNRKDASESELKEKSARKKHHHNVKGDSTHNSVTEGEPPLSSTVKTESFHKPEPPTEGSSHKELSYTNNNFQIQTHAPMVLSDQPLSEEDEYVELLSADANEYDYTNQLHCMVDSSQAYAEHEYVNELDTGDSRTFVNMDSGNVTLIKDTETLRTDVNDQTALFINNNEVMSSNVVMLNEISTEEVLPTPFGDRNENLSSDIAAESTSVNENIVTTENSKTTTSPTAKTPYLLNDESEIMKILEDIANGSLAVVSSFNPTSPDVHTNEIYMIDPNTGELCEEPLDLPQEIIKSILSVMT